MGRHLPEVPRKHRVPAALFDLLVAWRLRGHEAGRSGAVDLRTVDLELLFEELDVGVASRSSLGRDLGVEFVVGGRFGGLLGVTRCVSLRLRPRRDRLEARLRVQPGGPGSQG